MMMRLVAAFALAGGLLWLEPAGALQNVNSAETRGERVARQVLDRDMGRDSRLTVRMRLHDQRDRVRDRVFELLTLRSSEASKKSDEVGDRLLVHFTSPNDIRGTGLLVLEHPNGLDERFLYLPSLGRVRRIAGSEAQESFVGSDFTYEDIGGSQFEEYSYKLLEEQDVWTTPTGDKRPAYRLESTRKDGSARYPRVLSLILKDSLLAVHAEFFNKRNERAKTYTVRRHERVENIWTVLDAVITNHQEHTSTELLVDKIDYNVGLNADAFTRRALERGIP